MNDKHLIEQTKNLGFIDLCQGMDEDGDDAYLYLNIHADRYADYKHTCLSGAPFDPQSYGTVIAQGKGTPPASLIAELKDTYQFWDGFEDAMTKLGKDILAAKA